MSSERWATLGGTLLKVMLQGFFFFFQAEDGIRDLTVTEVQTCALPILGNFFGNHIRKRCRVCHVVLRWLTPCDEPDHRPTDSRWQTASPFFISRRILRFQAAQGA